MINNQWYAVLSSHQLRKGRILGARRFGEDMVFFRTESGSIGCLNSLCAHRKASLEKGRLTGDRIKCPFHGIEYDLTGKCVYVPAEGRASINNHSRFHMKRYHTREIGGIIFVWYGDKEPDKEPDVFDVLTDSSYSYDHTEDFWSVDYSRVIENQLDVSHLPFVHRDTIGRGNKTLCNGPKVVWLDKNTMQTSADNEVDEGQTPKNSEDSEIKRTNLTFKFPNMWLNHVTDKLLILAYFVPVDDEHAIIALRFYNRFTGIKAIDRLIATLGSIANIIVERQDKRIVETELPKKTGMSIGESLLAADLPILEYRRKRAELQQESAELGNAYASTLSEKKTDVYAGPMENEFLLNASFGKGETIMSENSIITENGNKKNVEMNTKAMYRLSYGLFVCTVRKGGKVNGCIINTAIQVASTPNRISIAVNKANYTHDMLKETGRCNVSVISTDAGFELFKHFGFQSGRDIDKFGGDYGKENYVIADNGIPYITDGTNAYFSLEVNEAVDLGSHTLFICEPVMMEVLSDTSSCTYEYYRKNIKPKPQAVGITKKGETVWRCTICGYEWIGEELPDDFICPICKHPKADFEKILR